MTTQTYPEPMSKVTAEIDRDLAEFVKNHFHQGQQTNLLRMFFLSLKKMIEQDTFNTVSNYMYGNDPLILPNPKGE